LFLQNSSFGKPLDKLSQLRHLLGPLSCPSNLLHTSQFLLDYVKFPDNLKEVASSTATVAAIATTAASSVSTEPVQKALAAVLCMLSGERCVKELRTGNFDTLEALARFFKLPCQS